MGRKFGEFCYYSCLPLLPGLACIIHATWGPPFSPALYISLTDLVSPLRVDDDGLSGHRVLVVVLVILVEDRRDLLAVLPAGGEEGQTHIYNVRFKRHMIS